MIPCEAQSLGIQGGPLDLRHIPPALQALLAPFAGSEHGFIKIEAPAGFEGPGQERKKFLFLGPRKMMKGESDVEHVRFRLPAGDFLDKTAQSKSARAGQEATMDASAFQGGLGEIDGFIGAEREAGQKTRAKGGVSRPEIHE